MHLPKIHNNVIDIFPVFDLFNYLNSRHHDLLENNEFFNHFDWSHNLNPRLFKLTPHQKMNPNNISDQYGLLLNLHLVNENKRDKYKYNHYCSVLIRNREAFDKNRFNDRKDALGFESITDSFGQETLNGIEQLYNILQSIVFTNNNHAIAFDPINKTFDNSPLINKFLECNNKKMHRGILLSAFKMWVYEWSILESTNPGNGGDYKIWTQLEDGTFAIDTIQNQLGIRDIFDSYYCLKYLEHPDN